jgi:predicted phosphodiesterase
MKTYAVINDLQIRFHDVPVLNLVVDFLGDLKPDGIIMNGDIVDHYALSDFDKNPLNKSTLNGEIADAGKLMHRLSKIAKECLWIGGNHEDRLRRFLWRKAPEFGLLPQFTFPALFNLQHYGFQWKEYGDSHMLGKLKLTHGNSVSKHSGQTARNHFDKYGMSTMIGHTHRLGIYYRRNSHGVHGAYENGCLCRLDPEYAQEPDWQQGFSIVHVDGNHYFNVQQIPILNRSHFYYGKDRIGKPVKSR